MVRFAKGTTDVFSESDDDQDDSSGMGTRPPSTSLPSTLVPTTNNSTSQSASTPHTPPSSPPSQSHLNQVQNLFSAESASATKYKRVDFNQTPSAKFGYRVEASNEPITPFLSPLQEPKTEGRSMVYMGRIPTEAGASIRVSKHNFSTRSSNSTLVSVETPLGAKSVASSSSDGSTSLRGSSTRKVLFKQDYQEPMQTIVDPKDLVLVHSVPEERMEPEGDAALLHHFGTTPPRAAVLPLATYKTPRYTKPERGATMSPEFSSFLVSNPSTPM
jgi:hypothetical protein